jgi:hypothetical protein
MSAASNVNRPGFAVVASEARALALRSTAASRSLAEEAKTLSNLIGFFSVGDTVSVKAGNSVRSGPGAERRVIGSANRRIAAPTTQGALALVEKLQDHNWNEF